jgi:hypothetical protein
MQNIGRVAPLLGLLVWSCGQTNKDTSSQSTTVSKKDKASVNGDPAQSTSLVTTSGPAEPGEVHAPIFLETQSPEILVSLHGIDVPSKDEIALSKIVVKIQEPNKPTIIKEFGEYPGCSEGEPNDEKALSSVRCFWSGGEDVFELFQEADSLVLRHTILGDEEATPLKPEEPLRVSLAKNSKVKISHPGDHLEITPDHVGLYRLQMTNKEANALPNALQEDQELLSFEPDGIELYLKSPGVVCSIAIHSQGPKTKEGLGVGSSLSEFQKQYGPMKWSNHFSALSFEKEPRLRVVVSFEETGRDHRLPRLEAKVTNVLVGDCEATEIK